MRGVSVLCTYSQGTANYRQLGHTYTHLEQQKQVVKYGTQQLVTYLFPGSGASLQVMPYLNKNQSTQT